MNICPFLLFDGNCAEAMEFYQSCLGGELTVTYVRDTPMSQQAPPQNLDKVAYAEVRNDWMQISATDWQHPTRARRDGNAVALSVSNGTYEQTKAVFERLAVGADPDLLDELRDMPFGSYGHLADRYGVHWFFQGEPASS
jgi:PhnB protein